jgi:tricorn protease
LLAFRRGLGNLIVLNLETRDTTTFVESWDTGLSWRWSPDSRYIAYEISDLNHNSDIWVGRTDGSEPPVNVTRHPDNDSSPRWSADGKILSFLSERVNEEYDVWSVYLDKDLEVYTPKELEQYYEEAVKAAKKREPLKVEKPKAEKPEKESGAEEVSSNGVSVTAETPAEESAQTAEKKAEEKADEANKKDDGADVDDDDKEKPKSLDLDDAYLRLRRVTSLNGNEGNLEMTPGGDLFIFTATTDERGLFSLKWDGTDRQRIADAASVEHVSLTGDKVILVSRGRAGTVAPTGKKVEFVDLEYRVRVDLQEQAGWKFLEMARVVGENFYDANLNGLNWPALTKKYHELARQTRTAAEFGHVGMRLVGELNGSHLGVYGGGGRSANAQALGRLGTDHARVADGYEITHVVENSPASKGPMALKIGDVITAIEFAPFGPTDTVESLLKGRVGKETVVTIRRGGEGEAAPKDINILITPISGNDLDELKYREWRRRSATQVATWSDGRIGYIHIEAMGQESLDVFERDLYAAAVGKDGLIIDVRNNGGGWTADRLLSSIMVQPHAYTLPRGADRNAVGHYPQDRLFIQRYTLPVNMLCNEKSFSNAEIVSHAFKTLKRGTLVGQQTYGGVISTGGTSLVDGTFVRLPFRGWFLNDGTDMERNGARPDIVVDQTPEAESRDEDEQLRVAVEDLVKRLD